jgi:hypothetical protein
MKSPNTIFNRDMRANGRMGNFVTFRIIFFRLRFSKACRKPETHYDNSDVDPKILSFHLFLPQEFEVTVNKFCKANCYLCYLPIRSGAAPVSPGELNEKSIAGYAVLRGLCVALL